MHRSFFSYSTNGLSTLITKVYLEFNSFAELLKHIKATGVNAIKDYPLTKGKVKLIEQDYIAKYGKIKLTYNPVFVII